MDEHIIEGGTTILEDGSADTYIVSLYDADNKYITAVVKNQEMIERFETEDYVTAIKKYSSFRKQYLGR